MKIEQVTPGSALASALTPLRDAVTAADAPWTDAMTEHEFNALLAHGWDGEPPRAFAGLIDGEPVVLGELWMSDYDNLEHAWLAVETHPEHRRRGYGTAMLAFLEGSARAKNRPKVGIGGMESTATAGFAGRFGYRWGSQGIVRRQDLAQVPDGWQAELDRALAEHAAEYELLQMSGPLPEELMEPMRAVWADINDAPTDDLDIEDEVFTPERIRGYEHAQAAAGRTMHRVIARHRRTGELAGHTIVAVEGERTHRGHQHDTTVAKAHRGHRLGLVLKATMMQRLLREEPQLRTIDTWNAESNYHMIAVNEMLGYRAMGCSIEYQRSLSQTAMNS